jgi:conjugal transfer pilus assembly protein TrbC
MLRALILLLLFSSRMAWGQEATLAPNWLEDAVKKYQTIQPLDHKKEAQTLYAFFSFGMPEASIQRMIQDAEKSGAILVLRGMKENSLQKTKTEAARIIGKHRVEIDINPTLFKRFNITAVPAVVMTRGDCETCKEAPKDSDYIKISGDVTLSYALEKLEDQYPDWKKEIERYKNNLEGKK